MLAEERALLQKVVLVENCHHGFDCSCGCERPLPNAVHLNPLNLHSTERL